MLHLKLSYGSIVSIPHNNCELCSSRQPFPSVDWLVEEGRSAGTEMVTAIIVKAKYTWYRTNSRTCAGLRGVIRNICTTDISNLTDLGDLICQ